MWTVSLVTVALWPSDVGLSLVNWLAAHNFADAAATGVYLDRDRVVGLYLDAAAFIGGAELERRAGR